MEVGLGTVQFGAPYGIANSHGQTPLDEVRKILALAHANGVHMLDTAYAYGTAEDVLGALAAADDF